MRKLEPSVERLKRKLKQSDDVCPGGEIGRHASLRGWWPLLGRGGSSPLLGTINQNQTSNQKFF